MQWAQAGVMRDRSRLRENRAPCINLKRTYREPPDPTIGVRLGRSSSSSGSSGSTQHVSEGVAQLQEII